MKNQNTIFTTILLAALLTCFAFSPLARAQLPSPPPDGGYPGNNTAEGDNALFNLDTSQGSDNTAIGFQSLFSLTTGSDNTAVGSGALYRNTSYDNTATGSYALYSNTTGDSNTANGTDALFNNDSGRFNNAVGRSALQNNVDGGSNNALGGGALLKNIHASGNTAIGDVALQFNDSTGAGLANYNTAVGASTLVGNTDGAQNTAVGFGALSSNTTGSNNVALGVAAGSQLTTGSNNIDIGENVSGGAGESNTIRIGTQGTQTRTFIAGIHGTTLANGVAVRVNANGRLGTAPSSARFKQDIRPMDKASEVILALKPVTFRYKQELDPEGVPQFGLVAEEVEKVNPDLVVRDEKGKPYSVRYDQVNAMLLNEFLEEHRKVEEQQATIMQLKSGAAKQEVTINQLKKGMGVLTAQLKEQAAQIQKVNARLELSRPAPQTVAKNH